MIARIGALENYVFEEGDGRSERPQSRRQVGCFEPLPSRNQQNWGPKESQLLLG